MEYSGTYKMEALRYIYELKKEVLLERLAVVKCQLQIIDEYEDLLKDE